MKETILEAKNYADLEARYEKLLAEREQLKADNEGILTHQTYDRAVGFAMAAHIKQVRKYTGQPYVLHCIEVAELILKYTKDYIIASAAVLHDTLEDTNVTEAELYSIFGGNITKMVLCVTDVSKPEDGNRTIRKAMDLEHLKTCSSKAASIKYADIVSNTKSIIRDDPGFARIYLPEIQKNMDVLKGKGNSDLSKLAEETLKNALKTLADWEKSVR